MKELIHKMKGLPTTTSTQEKNAQELQLLVDALVQKSNELGLIVNITFNTNQENLPDSTNGYTYYPQEHKTTFNTKEK